MGSQLVDRAFIDKLSAVVETNLENEQFGVEDLASKVGISRSQLHRKLQSSTGQSISQFIREFRLKRAMEMLQQGEATVGEISYQVGFGSPTYFSTCFSEYFGFPPGEAKFKEAPAPKSRPYTRKSILVIVGALLITTIVLLIYWLANPTHPDKSIAVIPFKNLGEDQINQHIADGIMDDILNHLSSIRDIRTISRTSSERYRNTNLSLPEIANELGVAYVLEGSVQKDGNNARIIVQLIEADQDSHVWSKRYDFNLSDIFAVQSEVAKAIAAELSAVLTPQEIDRIDLKPTHSLEAHYLYLMGRYYWRKRTEEDLNKSVEYFQKAVALDPKYALAHAGLADAYFIQTWWRWVSKVEGYTKAKDEVLKALELDPDLAEAHATYGGIACYLEWDWQKSEQELSRAIELKPNYATAHQYYSELLDILGRNREAEMEINQAINLDPLSVVLYMVKRSYHIRGLEYELAIEDQQKIIELRGLEYEGDWASFAMLTALGRDREALSEMTMLLSFENASEETVFEADSIYARRGLSGLGKWALHRRSLSDRSSLYDIACEYATIQEYELALDWLEKAMEKGESQLPRINNDLRFIKLQSDPRFNALLLKMGLPDAS